MAIKHPSQKQAKAKKAETKSNRTARKRQRDLEQQRRTEAAHEQRRRYTRS